ncbi:restriction endonuclease subunit S [Maridesulfovibrio ferrireducens]|uniref:restriction endonuclease subunit S n=1 Tax=Maridesulfovibrio ferrireducens TaxID=246191 RepID=UPI001A20973E|nr:restriction endonuclease subunit S [Maridesulfovibrio ferrireducens]MBI9109973.1 restriction endonuclease subunit S [Maridesulfovibrio ferrireducens]
MAVRDGYKQTEVGVIPEDWKVVEFGDIVNYIKGFGFKSSEYTTSGTRIIRVSDTTYSSIKDDNPVYILCTDNCSYKKWMLRENDLIFSTVGSKPPMYDSLVGKVILVTEKHEKCLLNQNAVLIRVKEYSDLIQKLLLNHFKTERYINYIETIFRGNANQASITLKDLFRYTIPLPLTKSEQESIAEALSDADGLIESMEQLIAKKRQVKQGAMQELLRPTLEWESTNLSEIADPRQKWSFTGGPFGSNLKSIDYTDEGVRIIQLQNIGDGKFKNDYEIYTSHQKADELISCNIYPGDIILSKMGDPVARACIIPCYHKRYLMCSDGIRLKVDQKKFNAYFIYTIINALEFRTKASNAGTGSTRKRIGLSELRNLDLFCPSINEQTAIATILSDMDAEITKLETKLSKARKIKAGMMQELLTGRIRLV